ncbi:type II secretion system protein [Candidatus Saccharibacteria bacterium]|nr:type II secretion system protein [Candidatus Saccharibacteria bacterium]
MSKKSNIKGFTIIEVVLVLAIAGLIFLMVFVALPALQRSQRDTQRRDDMARFLSQLTQFQANNNNGIPGSGSTGKKWNDDFVDKYLRVGGDKFQDPSGADYVVQTAKACTVSECKQLSQDEDYKNGYIRVLTNATCSGEDPVYNASKLKVAVTYKLEGSGIYCASN